MKISNENLAMRDINEEATVIPKWESVIPAKFLC